MEVKFRELKSHLLKVDDEFARKFKDWGLITQFFQMKMERTRGKLIFEPMLFLK